MNVLLAATRNADKVREMTPVLGPVLTALGLAFRTLEPGLALPPETRATFAGNAALKAFAAAAATGSVALGEDSGLEVEALGGRPGVHSARFSGGGAAENNRLLLERLAAVPAGRRGAAFRTVAVLKVPGGRAFVASGSALGEILDEPRGHGGFGYDPVFLSRDLGLTFAEVASSEKERVSHRSRALRALRGYLMEAFEGLPAAAGVSAGAGTAGVPGHAACREANEAAGCPPGLWRHQLAVGRLAREMAFLLAEAGVQVDATLAAAGGFLHDIGKGLVHSGQFSASAPNCLGAAPPEGVVPHGWHGAAWATERGLDSRLARVILVHGMGSLESEEHGPDSWEESIVMVADKTAEMRFVGIDERMVGLRRRYPGSAELFDRTEPILRRLEARLAAAGNLRLNEFRHHLASCLDVVELGPEAGVCDVR